MSQLGSTVSSGTCERGCVRAGLDLHFRQQMPQCVIPLFCQYSHQQWSEQGRGVFVLVSLVELAQALHRALENSSSCISQLFVLVVLKNGVAKPLEKKK